MNDLWENEEEEEEVVPRPIRRRRAPRNEQRGNLYLLTGLVIGLGLGLAYAWLISPVRYVDTAPISLANPYKDEYRQNIALAYAADHDLGRARERLALLDSASSVQGLAALAQRRMAENQTQAAKALALLAADLNRPPSGSGVAGVETQQTASPQMTVPALASKSPQAVEATNSQEPPTETSPAKTTNTPDISAAVQTPTVPLPTRTPTITLTPLPTFTARPTATPIPVLAAPFTLKAKREVCNGAIQPGLLQIEVTGADGKPLPGVPILISWKSGENVFYTGLAPEIDPGYADFVMSEGISYNLKVGEVSDTINGLTIPACGGGWNVEFQEKGTAQH